MIFVPARFAKQAMLEAAESDLKLVVCITEGIPTLDVLEAHEVMQKNGIRLVGPNSPGMATAGVCKVGIMPGQIVHARAGSA